MLNHSSDRRGACQAWQPTYRKVAMKLRRFSISFALVAAIVSTVTLGSVWGQTKKPAKTDAQIRQEIISASIASYKGSCACPYNVDRAGHSCGKRSAYSRPGGAAPLCY